MINRPYFQIKKRIIYVFFSLLLLIICLSLRLFWIQVIRSEQYQDKALQQRLRHLQVEPKRGIIYDNNHRQLAVSVSSQTVVAIPLEIEDPVITARKLSTILDLNYNTIYSRLTRQASAVYVKRKIAEEKVQQIRDLNLTGIIFTEESKRYYPGENLASHLLGFAGIDSQGLDGLELAYDRYLRGNPGKIIIERDAAGRTIPGGVQEFIVAEDGYSLYLTIDEVIQYITERELERALEEFEISGGSIIVMDPRDGAVLALSNRPDYNPNDFAVYEQRYWRNRAISDSFEPGSTFKIITASAALDQGIVDENDIFVCTGQTKVSGETIRCWKDGGHGPQTFIEVVQNSCNPGFVQVGMRLGLDAFYNYIQAFNFGQKTGISLPGEARGLVTNYEGIGPVELATISFGHGITVTPIQLVSAVAAVANDGLLLKPQLVSEIRTPEGELVEKIEPVPVRQVISEKTSREFMKMLENVVAQGTGKNAQIEGYRIGGKTGTAKHYGQEIYDSSFIGVLPVDDPRLVILVVLYDITSYPYYGSQTAAPLFRNVAYDIIRYLDISPRSSFWEEKEIVSVEIPRVIDYDYREAERVLREKGLNVNILGSGDNVFNQIPLPGAVVKNNSTVILFTEDNLEYLRNYFVMVPDFMSLNTNDAANLAAELGLKISAPGIGTISEQNIEPGVRVPGGTEIKVSLND